MELAFYYIEGISNENTYYFESLEKQNDYFANLASRKVITETFYPPYYRNYIKVSTSDIDLSSSINYMSLEYNDKTYYYFIDKVDYINEDVLGISVSMDTIQTFMFNITVNDGNIRRRFIDRFIREDDNLVINRDYIRENVSGGIEGKHEITLFNTQEKYQGQKEDKIKGWYIIVANGDNTDATPPHQYYAYYKGVGVSYMIMLVPDYNFFNSVDVKVLGLQIANTPISDKTARTITIKPWATIAQESKSSRTISISYVPLNIFSSYIKVDDTGTMIVGGGENPILYWYDESNGVGAILGNSAFRYKIGSTGLYATYNVPFFRGNFYLYKSIALPFDNINKITNQRFTKDYVPALLDENYYKVSYGNGVNQTTYPLHLLKYATLVLKYYYDWQGYQYFALTKVFDTNYYNTIVSCDPSNIDLISNAFEQYSAYNKWSIAGAIASTVIGVGASLLTANPMPAIGATASSVSTIAGGASGAAITATDISRMPTYSKNAPPTHFIKTEKGKGISKYGYYPTGSPSSYDTPYNMRFNTASLNDTYEFQEGSRGFNISGQAVNQVQHLIAPITAMANAYSAPNTVKSFGSLMQNRGMINYDIRLETLTVTDIDSCAQYYHRYGYLVNEYINKTSSIFTDINTRYYYNYIEMASVSISCNCLVDQNILGNLELRFMNGIRLWNTYYLSTNVDIGNYTYDNVERSNL